MIKRILLLILAFTAVLVSCPFVTAEENFTENYNAYLKTYEDVNFISEEILIDTSDSAEFCEEEQSQTFEFSSEFAGYCHIEAEYGPVANPDGTTPSVSVALNDTIPFTEADSIELKWKWKNGKTEVDERGNEIQPDMIMIEETLKNILIDPSGRQNEPLKFLLKEGSNKITVTVHTGKFKLNSLRFFAPKSVKKYSDIQKEYKQKGYKDAKDFSLKFEAEDADLLSDSSLTSDYDKGNAATSPNNPLLLQYNIISGDKFNSAGQWLMWEFTPEASGLYEISFRARQNDKSGFSSTRRIYINDETPFEECKTVDFRYDSDWYIKTFGDETPYKFYFEKGKTYKIKVEGTAGTLADITLDIDDLVYDLNTLYRSVIMVAGTSVDNYRDYQLDIAIPDFFKTVADLKTRMEKTVETLKERNSGKSGSELTALQSLINRLELVEDDADLLARTSASFKNDIQSLSAWNQDAKSQPLDIDYMMVHSPDYKLPKANAPFFKSIGYTVLRLLYSFADDYGVVGEIHEKEDSISVWIGTGREQLSIFKKLVDNRFVPENQINVNVSIISTDIRNAVLAGTAPDVALFISGDLPVNLALRDAVCDLKKFDGFSESQERFDDSAMLPFMYNGGCYALPVTETYNMLFVRTDIFEELEIEIPKTWEEFYQVATVIQRNNLEVGIPSDIGMFATLLFQNGGEFFSSDLTQTGFNSEAAIEAFKTWTGLFSKYGFPLTYNFYNRFSSGEMPLGIADYSQYLMLKEASPEIAGRWIMTTVPGTLRDDGTIDNTISISVANGTGTNPGLSQSVAAAVIFEQSEKKQDAWKLIDWFTSDEIQADYGRDIEATLGTISRYTTANINAFNSLAWTKSEKALLSSQRENIKGINEIPGNYSVTREIINAFRGVVYENSNPTDTLHRYNIKINKEIERKANAE